MRIEYDPKHDLLNIEFIPDAEINDSVEMDGIIFDYGEGHCIVSLEIMDAGKRTKHSNLDQLAFEMTKG